MAKHDSAVSVRGYRFRCDIHLCLLECSQGALKWLRGHAPISG